jgi:glycosyltransferase involved in cell wall biosynthesis
MKVQALIPSFNESRHIEACVRSLAASKIPQGVNFEILISDNASSDNTVEILHNLSKEFLFVKYSVQKRNIGARRNFLSLIADSDAHWMFYIDAHDQVEEGYVESLIQNCIATKTASIGFEKEHWDFGERSEFQEPKGNYIFHDNRHIRILQAVLYLGHNTLVHSLIPATVLKDRFSPSTKILSFDLLFTYAFLSELNLVYIEKRYFRRYVPNQDGNYSAVNSAGFWESRNERVSGAHSEVLSDYYLPHEFKSMLSSSYGRYFLLILYSILRLKHSKSPFLRNLFRTLRWIFGVITPWRAWNEIAMTSNS